MAEVRVVKQGDEYEGLSLPLYSVEETGVTVREGTRLLFYYHNEVESDRPYEDEILPENAQARKDIPVYSGFITYFPDAIVAVSKLSLSGGLQHGQTRETLHWDRTKSTDHTDALMRHLIEEDWTAVAWRALAQLQKSIEEEK